MVSHRRYKQPTKLRIYIARLQGAILCYVFLYVFCSDFIFVSFHFLLAITEDVNTRTWIQHSTVNSAAPSRCHGRGRKVTCNASYVCVHSLTCACWSIIKCPVTLIINPVPLLVCKEIDSYPPVFSRRDTLHVNAYRCVCVRLWDQIQLVRTIGVSVAGSHGSWRSGGGGEAVFTG